MDIPRKLILAASTFLYVGYLPLAPGTFGSICGVFLFFLAGGNAFIYVLLTLLALISGFVFAGRAERILGIKDSSCIVIDEVSGMLISLMFIPLDIKFVVIAFVLFRILDTLKPFPAGRLQDTKGSVGIMSDDIIAGIYTNIILQFVLRITSFRIS